MSAAERWIGKEIGEYRITEHISDGGMASVFRAEHKLLGNLAAVKILNPVLSTDPEIRERFLQEARIQIALQHTNIVRVLNAYSTDEYSALVLELVEGQSLDKVLKRRGKLSVDEALTIFKQVLDAVGHAHEMGVIHRDLKPSNIIVCADGTAKVTDFGIAKVLGDTKLTRTGTSMGSPDYMSPEQVLGKKDIDHRTDIYSLGATLYEMLTGRPPFVIENGGTSDSDFLVKQAHVQQTPEDPRNYQADIGDRLSGIVLSALSKLPSERMPSCTRFAELLFDREVKSAGKKISSPRVSKHSSEGYPKRKSILLSAITLLFATALLFIIPRSGFLLSHLKCGLGNASSCETLGDLYYEGQGVRSNWFTARSYYEKACKDKQYKSCFYLGEMYRRGEGGKTDDTTSSSLFKTACDEGNVGIACNSLADGYLKSRVFTDQFEIDVRERFRLVEKGCELQDVYSCLNLAHLYQMGFHGAAPNKERAEQLRSQSARLVVDNCMSYRYCGALPVQFKGESDRLNGELRAKLQESCDSGKIHSCVRFAEKPEQKKPSCEKGSLSACVQFAFTVRDITEKAILFKSNCESGDPIGCKEYGEMLLSGKGVAKDEDRGKKLLLDSCDSGNHVGCNSLALFLYDRAKSYSDHEMVRHLLGRGCSERGCALLAKMEINGIGGATLESSGIKRLADSCLLYDEKNYTECKDWFEISSNLCSRGSSEACTSLSDYWFYKVRSRARQLSAHADADQNRAKARSRQLAIFEKECALKNADSCIGAAALSRWRFSNNEKKAAYFAFESCRQGSKKGCAFFWALHSKIDENRSRRELSRMCSVGYRSSCMCIEESNNCDLTYGFDKWR